MNETSWEDFITSKRCGYMIRPTSAADCRGMSEGALSRKTHFYSYYVMSRFKNKIFSLGFDVAYRTKLDISQWRHHGDSIVMPQHLCLKQWFVFFPCIIFIVQG